MVFLSFLMFNFIFRGKRLVVEITGLVFASMILILVLSLNWCRSKSTDEIVCLSDSCTTFRKSW